MTEQPMYFGTDHGLLGILTRAPQPLAHAPGAIVLNAGLLHRVGPNRLSVDIDRRLASRGYHAFRFDMSGIGDSEITDRNLLDIERSVLDAIAAMDAMTEATGITRFVLMGLCTGAYNAFRTALVDPRVAGCVLIDGYSYPTLRSRWMHYRGRVLQLDRWRNYLKRRLGRVSADPDEETSDLIVFENEVVSKERFGSELGDLLDRGTRMLMVYTGLGPLAYTYRGQLAAAFPHLDIEGRTSVRFYPDADHTFRLPGNRALLIDDIDTWMRSEFPGDGMRESA